MGKIVDFFTDLALTVAFGVEQLAVVLVAMIPLIELKGAIPIGVKFGMSHGMAYLWAFLGSTLVVIPLYWLLRWLFKLKFFKRILTVFQNKAAKLLTKSKDMQTAGASKTRVTLYKFLGVLAFVAIPIPLTGVWTGTFIAVILDLKFRWTVPAIVLGNAIAGGLILLLTFLLGAHLDLFLFILFGIAALLAIYFLYKVFTVKLDDKKDL